MKSVRITVCIILLCCTIPEPGMAQISGGVLGGLNFSKVRVEDNQGTSLETKSRTGYQAGIMAETGLAGGLSLGANILYLEKAAEVRTAENITFDVRTAYIEIPLFLKYTFGEKLHPHVLLGPTVGFLLHSEVDVEQYGLNFTGDFAPALEKMDFGFMMGAGVELPLGNGRLHIQGRYRYGTADIIKGGTVDLRAGSTLHIPATIDTGDRLFTSGIQVMAGYSLPLAGD